MAEPVVFALVGVTLAAAGFGLLYGKSAVVHYRIRHDGNSLYRVLCTRLQPGDSRRKVTRLLGLGTELQELSRSRLLEAAKKRPEYFPDGALATDVFLNYPCGGPRWSCLQFRDEKLVNFQPAPFERCESVACCLAAPANGPVVSPSSEGT